MFKERQQVPKASVRTVIRGYGYIEKLLLASNHCGLYKVNDRVIGFIAPVP